MQYPLMAPVARYMLGVRASQATAERVFSSSGRHRLAFTNLDPHVLGASCKAMSIFRPFSSKDGSVQWPQWPVSETVTVETPKKGEIVNLDD